MLTWLDYYVKGARASAALLGRFDTDLEAMFALIVHSLALEKEVARPAFSGESLAVRKTLYSMIMPFCARALFSPRELQMRADQLFPEKDLQLFNHVFNTKAVRLNADLVALLSHAKAPNTNEWLSAISHATWYIDLPHKALMLNDRLQVRAIFTQPTRNDRHIFLCVLTEPNKNAIVDRLAWMLEKKTEAPLADTYATDTATVRENVENFVKLLVLYESIAEKTERVPLPRVTISDLAKLKEKKAVAKQKTHTLFSVVDLRSPPNRFGRTNAPSLQQAWRLDRRITVRGHFRWQAYGEKMSKRKLIWIDSYERGPQDAPTPTTIVRL